MPELHSSEYSGEIAEPPRSKSDPEYYVPMQEAARLRDKADRLKGHAIAIAEHNGELNDLVAMLAGGGTGSWQGRRANKFANEWQGVNGDVSNWVQQIDGAAENLYSEAAALVRQAEDYLAGG